MSDKGYRGSPRPAMGGDRHGLSILKDYRNYVVILALGLIILTGLSCLPYTPQGPFDARDYTRMAGMRLEQHPWEALVEPLAAPMLILGGAPDFRVAFVAVLIWVLLGAAAWGMFAEYRAQRVKKPLAIALKGIRMAFVASSTLTLIVLLFVVARFPGWRLVVDDPDLVVADLHSHTTKSHDGLVSLRTSLEWHASCGYNVVALTEHDELFAHETQVQADASFDRLPAFISGLEAHTGRGAMVIGLCQDPYMQLGKQGLDEFPDRTAWFSRKIHEDCGGAVIVVTLNRLGAGDIARLADDGVDGFEIVNSGHPELRPDLRRDVLDTCRSRGLVLVASTDWHGWTGLAKTWTVIRAPGASALSHQQRANLAISKLREHNSADVIPVVAGYLGAPSLVRAIFSPIAETLRYAQELSTCRVISWWVWVWAVFVLCVFLQTNGVPPGGVLLVTLVGATGLGLIFSALSLISQGTESVTSFPLRIGLIAVAIGAAAVVCSVFGGVVLLMRMRRRGHIKASR
jgi:hypothetical protein